MLRLLVFVLIRAVSIEQQAKGTTIDSKQLFRKIAEVASFTEGDLAGIMVALEENILKLRGY